MFVPLSDKVFQTDFFRVAIFKPWSMYSGQPFSKREMTSFDSIIRAHMSCTTKPATVPRAHEKDNARLLGLVQAGDPFTAKQRRDRWLWASLSMQDVCLA